jgi:peroxiredoxin
LLVDRALADLDELRALGPGKLAPEIDGMTVDGARMRLSDYRGRVVALAFWGDWCSLCRAMLGHERALVERFRGRPFALVGVNSDNRRDIASSLEAKGTVTWRSWVDGGEVRGGAIARRWNVTALPTFFVIDAKGVIRLKVGPRPDDHDALYILDEHTNLRNRWELRAEAVSEEVEALVKEAEARD